MLKFICYMQAFPWIYMFADGSNLFQYFHKKFLFPDLSLTKYVHGLNVPKRCSDRCKVITSRYKGVTEYKDRYVLIVQYTTYVHERYKKNISPYSVNYYTNDVFSNSNGDSIEAAPRCKVVPTFLYFSPRAIRGFKDPTACIVMAGDHIQLKAKFFHPFRHILHEEFRMQVK